MPSPYRITFDCGHSKTTTFERSKLKYGSCDTCLAAGQRYIRVIESAKRINPNGLSLGESQV